MLYEVITEAENLEDVFLNHGGKRLQLLQRHFGQVLGIVNPVEHCAADDFV